METKKIKKTILTGLFLLLAVYISPQDEINEINEINEMSQMNEMVQRSSIPQELLRPRRGEAPRYPIDTVIGALGQGDASPEAYEITRRIAAALLAGNMNIPVLASINKVFLEDCMTKLKSINPQSFRLGGGREEPDGSISFLVRFIGREEGITGELFVRLEERRPKTEPPPPAVKASPEPADIQPADSQPENAEAAEPAPENENSTAAQAATQAATQEAATQAVEPPVSIPVQKIWLFEDLILEEPRSREAENRENRHRFDFSPYERFY